MMYNSGKPIPNHDFSLFAPSCSGRMSIILQQNHYSNPNIKKHPVESRFLHALTPNQSGIIDINFLEPLQSLEVARNEMFLPNKENDFSRRHSLERLLQWGVVCYGGACHLMTDVFINKILNLDVVFLPQLVWIASLITDKKMPETEDVKELFCWLIDEAKTHKMELTLIHWLHVFFPEVAELNHLILDLENLDLISRERFLTRVRKQSNDIVVYCENLTAKEQLAIILGRPKEALRNSFRLDRDVTLYIHGIAFTFQPRHQNLWVN